MESVTTYTEQELLLQLKAGDETAFTAIYNRYWEQLFFLAHKRLASADDAKEVIQNVFFNLWQKRDRLEIEQLSSYLAAMTRYAVYRQLANQKRRHKLAEDFHLQKSEKNCKGFDIDNKQFLEMLLELANDLPENYRVVFIQHKIQDRPLQEVAKDLGVSVRTAERYVDKLTGMMRNFRRKLASFMLL